MVPTDSRNPASSGKKETKGDNKKLLSPVSILLNIQGKLVRPDDSSLGIVAIGDIAGWIKGVREVSPDEGLALICEIAKSEDLDTGTLYECIHEYIQYFYPPAQGDNTRNRNSSGGNSGEGQTRKSVPVGVSDADASTANTTFIKGLVSIAEGGRKGETPKLPEGFNQKQVETLLGLVTTRRVGYDSYARAFLQSEKALRGRAKGYKALNQEAKGFRNKSEGDIPADPSPSLEGEKE